MIKRVQNGRLMGYGLYISVSRFRSRGCVPAIGDLRNHRLVEVYSVWIVDSQVKKLGIKEVASIKVGWEYHLPEGG